MKNIYFIILSLLFSSLSILAQSNWLAPETSYKSQDIITDKAFACHDILGDSLYAVDSDGLYSYDLNSMQQKHNYGKAPATYSAWVSFVTADPNGKRIWVGYTSNGLADDRIYTVDIASGTWTHVATFPGNFDMEINEGKYYVSGLNTEGWDGINDVNCISLLDTTGADLHKKLIEIGGNSTGLAVDKQGNVYNAKYDPTGTETYLYKWLADSVQNVIEASDGHFLQISSGILLSVMPNNGPYDCDIDDAGNLIFNCNDFAGGCFLAVWDGNTGNARNYTKIGTYGGSFFAWFSMVKATGDMSKDGKAYMINFGDPIAELHLSSPPEVEKALGTVSAYTTDANVEIDLSEHFSDPDDESGFTYEIVFNSADTVAMPSIRGEKLVLDFFNAGQTTICVNAISNGQSVSDRLIVGVKPEISGAYFLTDFEDLALADENYWNGADGSGGFVSGLAKFGNTNSGGFWSEWGYSNTSDVTTAGFTNQYSAITGSGFDPIASNGKNYGVAFVSNNWVTNEPKDLPIAFADTASHLVKGFYLTNSTYASLCMEQGDPFAKKFGGESGSDPDFFKLLVWGKKDGVQTDTVEYYLADYRFEDDTKDYIVKTWQWIELSTLGKVDTLWFSLASSDVGMWGINTPMYFNVDNIYIVPDVAPVLNQPMVDITEKDNAPNKIIDLSALFSDEDDDMLSVSVLSNSNPEVATVSLLENELTVDFLAEGTTTLIVRGSANNKWATDTMLINVLADRAPTVANAMADMEVYKNASNSVLSLVNVFTDADDEDANIIKSVLSNSNNALVTATITGDEMTLSFTAETVGEAEIVIEAESNGKTVRDTFMVFVSMATNIESSSFSSLVLYPNPSNGIFRIKSNDVQKMSVKIYSLHGRLIYSTDNYANSNVIDMSSQASGQYLIKIKQGTSISTKSMILK